ncbi:beta-xylosidase [Chromatiales bacterium (ex Bugula neritina AB1)]|nr:beta-xylosidase [Chromatiales bacterium (ex Bugula neritina AB1)]
MINNPILTGFNPDPSICRAGKDYYIATSTFEWYPGVQIYHSRNLADWTLIARPLNRASQLDMRGNPDSCGVWAPCLSYADNKFWLIYTDVKRFDGNFKDAHNYLVTADSVTGQWSDPVYINSSGFDPSLFHDDDGRKWFYNLVWNHRAASLGQSPLHSPFGGIVCQEYSHSRQQLIGEPELVFSGTEKGLAEAPHVFKRAGYYYLIVAEGGTGYEHAVTHARGRTVTGPFELHPDKYLLTATPNNRGQLQRTGHGMYVETEQGEAYHTFLCSRPLPGLQRSPLGRETGIERCIWGDDGWLRTSHGSQQAHLVVESPAELPASGTPMSEDTAPRHTEFNIAELPIDFQWLRTPYPERLFSLTERQGFLRLYGRESIGSWFEQSLLARRQQHHCYSATTTVEFQPVSFQQSAGLTAYYNRHKFHYLQITHDEALGRVVSVMSCNGDYPDTALSFPSGQIPVPGSGAVSLQCTVTGSVLEFAWKTDGDWRPIGPALDASVLSDEGGRGEHASFTGAFIGMIAFDTSGRAQPADFSHFTYEPQAISPPSVTAG